jgi:hypothetical protein
MVVHLIHVLENKTVLGTPNVVIWQKKTYDDNAVIIKAFLKREWRLCTETKRLLVKEEKEMVYFRTGDCNMVLKWYYVLNRYYHLLYYPSRWLLPFL